MKICLIGTTHPSHNPRLVREADTLVEFGYQVSVVAPSYIPKLVLKDKALMVKRKWKLVNFKFAPLGYIGKFNFYKFIIKRKIYKKLFNFTNKNNYAEKSFVLAIDSLIKLAIRENADWYIAHTQGALPIAAKASYYNGAKYGFDCEDLLSENGIDPPYIVSKIEDKYIKKCNYISTPSNEISKFLIEKYSIKEPIVLYNVFPKKLTDGMKEPKDRPKNSFIKVHWMSQVISKKRGVQEAIKAMGQAGGNFELYLRGSISERYKADLIILADQNNTKVYFLPQIKHDEVIKSMEEYDIGLASETGLNKNFSKTVTNKIFSYMLAGLVVVASRTPGQLEVLKNYPNSSYLYEPGNLDELTQIFKKIKNSSEQLIKHKQNSWELAREKYCWDIEKNKFLNLFN